MKFVVAMFPLWGAENPLHRTEPAAPLVPPSTSPWSPLSHRTRERLPASPAGPWLGLPPAAATDTPGHPSGLLGLPQLVRPLIAMEIGWAVPTSCLILPAHTPGVGLGTHHLLETNLLAVVPGFCAQGQIEPEIQGISKLNLHPVAGSGSCCNSEVKETVCCHKIKQCFNVLPLRFFKSNV